MNDHAESPCAPLDMDRLRALLPDALQPRVQVWGRVDSTQRILQDQKSRWLDRMVILAEQQTAGRGRRGRTWLSPPGAALALSMRIQLPAARATGFSLALGIAAVEALHALGLCDVRVKWPNDLWVQGAKLGGILVESTECDLVAGIGINHALPEGVRVAIQQPCTDIQRLSPTISREAVAAAVISHWNSAADLFIAQGLSAFATRWPQYDALLHAPVTVLSHGHPPVTGMALGIDGRGWLLVEVEGYIQAFSSAEVSLRAL